MKKYLGAVVGMCLTLVMIAGPAAAESTVTVERGGSSTWLQGSIEQGEFSTVVIKIVTKDGAQSRVWQKCSFAYSGAGDYRCGIDSAAGSLAADQTSSWVAKVSVDGRQVARQSFTL
jgi:hypothetical protein